jgi:tetratricopeptide (TPR) repeat protein
MMALQLEDYAGARQNLAEGLALFQQAGDRYGMAIALNTLGRVAYQLRDFAEAERCCLESLDLARALGNRWIEAYSLSYLGQIAAARCAYPQAQRLLLESLAIRRERRDRRGTALIFRHLAAVSRQLGDLAGARQMYGQALGIFQELGQVMEMMPCLYGLASILAETGEPARALALSAFVRDHPASTAKWRDAASALYAALAAQLPEDTVSAADQAARAGSLETAANALGLSQPAP